MIRALCIALFVSVAATAAHAELDGPLSVVDMAHPQTATLEGHAYITYPAAPGVHVICTASFYVAHADVLATYRDAIQVNLQAVYAGDDPANPHATVALTFPDQATADAVRAQLLP
ncbi:hypothetical protein [Phenylobacterium sp.]|uniref:hypothetical protein n=1 Tax=Phenylobacterium sp. TaxID=1871053 RepID=UPI002DF5F12C|nr:hypothetical protein [Phenylobacterium sp.]